jgi:hypothetical protein
VLATAIAWAAFFTVVGLALGLGRSRKERPAAPLALSLAFGLLFSPHLFFHDLLAWTVPVALARGTAKESARRPWDVLALSAPVAIFVAAAVEPAIGVLLPLAPQLVVPLFATERLVREVRSQ